MDEFDNVFDDEFNDLGENTPSQQQEDTSDLTTEVLKIIGINDPQKIKFVDDTGAIVERSWDSLDREEQLNILVQKEQEPEQGALDDSEAELIKTIRESGMGVQEYLNSLQPEPPAKEYQVESLTDEDLYALDLIEKTGSDNITDEEIVQAVEQAKQNEDLFKKTVEGLRKEYIRLQEDKEAQLAYQQEAKREEEYQKFATSIQNEIKGLSSFAGKDLELSDDDIEDLSAFILDLDESGMSAFGKAMNDPALFTRAAFWILNEDKIVEELTKQIQASYTRGYEMAKKDLQGSKLVFSPTSKKTTTDDFIDDDDW